MQDQPQLACMLISQDPTKTLPPFATLGRPGGEQCHCGRTQAKNDRGKASPFSPLSPPPTHAALDYPDSTLVSGPDVPGFPEAVPDLGLLRPLQLSLQHP